MDGCQEVPGKFVVTSCDPPEVLEAAEATFDDIAPFIGALAEAVEGYPVGFVWNDRLRAVIDDFGAKAGDLGRRERSGERVLQKTGPDPLKRQPQFAAELPRH